MQAEKGDQRDLGEGVEGLVDGKAPGHETASDLRGRDPEGVRRILGLLGIRGHVYVVAMVGLHHIANPVDEAQLRGDVACIRRDQKP